MSEVPNLGAETHIETQKTEETARQPAAYDFSATEKAINEAAARINALWIAFIFLCVYIFIATYTVTPSTLFREATVRLPIFNADLPLKVYFIMAPLFVLTARIGFRIFSQQV